MPKPTNKPKAQPSPSITKRRPEPVPVIPVVAPQPGRKPLGS